MKNRGFLIFICAVFAFVAMLWGTGQGWAQSAKSNQEAKGKKGQVTRDEVFKKFGKVTPAEQEAAAKRARQAGLYPGIAGLNLNGPVGSPAAQAPSSDGVNLAKGQGGKQ